MTSNQQHDIQADGDDVRLAGGDIDDNLIEQLPDDERLQSGVPADQRASDLDFIQMTGLTRSQRPRGQATAPVARGDDLDPETPVSFYEEGVEDVDASMAPGSMETPGRESEDVGPPRHESSSIAQLKGIIADLTEEKNDLTRSEPRATSEANGPEAPLIESNDIDGGDAPAPEPPEEDSEEILIDADEIAVEPLSAAAPPLAPPPPPPRSDPEPLREAEHLLDELQRQPREVPPDAVDDGGTPPPPAAMPTGPLEVQEEKDASVYRRPLRPHARRRSRKSEGRTYRRLARWGVRATVVLAACAAVGVLYLHTAPLLLAPDETLAKAEALARKGLYEKASDAYLSFARVHPLHADRAQAQFEAAFALLQVQADTADKERRLLERALSLFETFVEDNPGHTWTIRAHSLIGTLYYRLGAFDEAIDALSAFDIRLQDPDAALPSMRILARAYARTGDYAAAESLYLQAASLSGNYEADADYYELGELFLRRAENAQDAQQQDALRVAAVDYWNHAIHVPGIDPLTRTRIMEKCDWLSTHITKGTVDASSPDSAPGDPAPLGNADDANEETTAPESPEDLAPESRTETENGSSDS